MSRLVALPVARWARLVSEGTLRLSGRLVTPVDDQLPRGEAVRVQVLFEGRGAPRVVHARVARGALGEEQELPEELPLDAVVARLSDVAIEATGTPSEGLAMELARDLRLALEPDVKVIVTAHTVGPPEGLRLCRPLVVGFGGAGVRLEHGAYRRLSRLAAIRLHRAELHPDGRVLLAGRGPRLTDAAVQRGLEVASRRVTRLVREGRRLRSLRPLLQVE